MLINTERGFTCKAYAWSTQVPIVQDDEGHAFRYEVREYGKLIGYITADRARSHPDVKWKNSRVGETEEFHEEYRTVEEAFAAF
jgi:hypothetical protein